ncbi:MAG: uroporphyrinogen decarboxylase family protein [Planctomycetota bacterium]
MIPYEGKNRWTVNYLKAVRFDHPDWTPCHVSIMPATWMKYREQLEDVVLAHPKLFPGLQRGKKDFDANPNPTYQEGRCTDCWSNVWENIEPGLAGQVVVHPLADWSDVDDWTPPDPETDDRFGPRDWDAVARRLSEAKRRGDLAMGNPLPHGFFYMLLYYLRGFENLMVDLATDEPHLGELIRIIERYNVAVIGRTMDCGAEMIALGEDLGLQRSLPISPAMWRKWIKPSYERMMGPCRDRGVPVRFHTDGHVLEIIPDLIEAGVTVLNPQIRANGLAGLQAHAKGKVALDQDLDRQLFPFATPSQIDDHIGEVFEGLHDPAGGLILYAEVEPDVPPQSVDAICTALERVCKPPEPQEA